MLHNALTSNPTLQRAFRRALGEMSNNFSGLERGSESLQPVMDLWALPEWAIIRGEIIFSRQTSIAAGGAGTFTSLELVNPTGSGILAVLLEIWNNSGIVQGSVDSGTAIGAGATRRGLANDARFPQLGEVSTCTVVEGAAAVAGISLPQDALFQGERSMRPYILPPGRKFTLFQSAANTLLSASFLWTERRLLSDEQNP